MKKLAADIRQFAKDRDWDKFHSPKNLAMGLAVEASELLEVILWKTDIESAILSCHEIQRLREEVGDVMIYLVNLTNKFGLDPLICAKEKLKLNRQKYPADVVKGSSKKYTEYTIAGRKRERTVKPESGFKDSGAKK